MEIAGISAASVLVLPITLIAFAILLMVIVFIHEYGHFSIARLLGVRVEVFSIGFGKPFLKWVDKKGTEWRLAPWPLGGYVKFFGDLNPASQASPEVAEETQGDAKPVTTQFPRPGHEDEIARALTAEERKVCFHFKPLWARAAIVAAGPFANFVLAIAIFTGLFMGFGRSVLEPVIGAVSQDSAAYEAGFEPGDLLLSVNGREISQFNQLYDRVLLSGGEEMVFEIQRDGEQLTIPVTPRRVEDTDRYGNPIERWLLGIAPDGNAVEFKKYGFFAAMREGIVEVNRVLSMTIKYLGKIITGKENAEQLSGPLKMAQYAGQSVMSGFDDSAYSEPPSFWTKLKVSLVDFISLAAVVSVSIGFLNLLPVPVLDGGHLLYYGYEALAGKPLGVRAQAIGFRVGIVLLASLMIFVTWNDINNLLHSLS